MSMACRQGSAEVADAARSFRFLVDLLSDDGVRVAGKNGVSRSVASGD